MFYLTPLIASFFIVIIVTPFVRRFALNKDIVDYPQAGRKIHKQPTPLLGGIAIFLGTIPLLYFFYYFHFFVDPAYSVKTVGSIVAGSFILLIGGFLDDIFNLKPRFQIIFPIVAILFVLFSDISIKFITNPYGGVIEMSTIFGYVMTFFWILGMMYTTKLLDGLDGLVSGIGAIASLAIFILSLSWDRDFSGTSVFSLLVFSSCIGFLLYNFYPAKIFLGEIGSLLIGFFLAVMSIISGSKIATTFLVMGLPVIDVIWVIIQRIKQRKKISLSGTEHFHFQLIKKGLSQRKAVLILYLISFIFGCVALFLNTAGKIISVIILSFFSLSLIGFYYYRKLDNSSAIKDN